MEINGANIEEIVRQVLNSMEGRGQAAAPAAQPAPAAAADDELLAVITAAIAAACGPTARVISYSPVKVPASSAWKNVGRLQNTEGLY